MLFPLLFAWLVLAIARQRQRFLQTGTALLGVAVLAEIVLYPLGSLLTLIGVDRPAALPIGVGNGKLIQLIPGKEAIIYRNFLQGSGPRSIGVGYPEKAHLAFDNESARSAEQVRIAELEQVLGRMTLENEILKKASTRLTSLSSRNEK